MKPVNRLLRKNTSKSRIAGFVVSNFIGLAIVLGALQFYLDAGSIWTEEGSFIDTDYLVINKRVTSRNTLSGAGDGFSAAEISDIESQPWVRRVGKFRSNDFKVSASVGTGSRSMSTYMFFESIPDNFVDVPQSQWSWRPGSESVPIIIPRDYLTLYNFGFAGSAGLPQMSEGIMSGIPLQLTLRSSDGIREEHLYGYVAGYSNRLNTILVPDSFLSAANERLGNSNEQTPSRLILDVNSPGDVAITDYLTAHELEMAGDKTGSQAAFMLKLITGMVILIGGVITVLSFFILLLSISLIMEKNRMTLHKLLLLGYPLRSVGAPYIRLIVYATLLSLVLALGGVYALRAGYMPALIGMGAVPAGIWIVPVAGIVLTGLMLAINTISVRRRVFAAWRV